MKKLYTLLLCSLFLFPVLARTQTIYDLNADWSDTSNPNGVWAYREGLNPLPHVNWGIDPLFYPAWAYNGNAAGGFGHVPVWMKLQTSLSPGRLDWLIGDVVIHSTSNDRGESSGPANVTWTSPFSGRITISGSAWIDSTTPRSQQWTLYLNGTPLSSGQMFAGGPYFRWNPFDFAQGSGGPAVLTNINVSPGDVVMWEIVRIFGYGDFVGVNLRITGLNQPPVANAGPDQTLECANPAGTLVTLNGSGSDDLDHDTLTYTWTGPFPEGDGTVTGVSPTVTLPLGPSTVTLVVNDGTVNSAGDSVQIDIQVFVSGLQPPMVGLTPVPAGLTPEEVPPLLPTTAFKQGSTIPLKLQLFCSGLVCTNATMVPPRIVGLFASGGPIDLTTVDIDAGAANDNGIYFRSSGPNWVYNLSTQGLSPATYTITILLPDGRRFNAGFVLR